MKPWSEIPEGRERDAAVAIHVLGWEPQGIDDSFDTWRRAPHFTTSADDDYRVLEHVRREWDREVKWQFGALLHKRLEGRWRNPHPADECFMVAFYEPGDYSAAAYEALRLSKGEQ